MRPFVPFFRNAHLATIAGNFWTRAVDESRFPTKEVLYDTEPGTRVLVHENRPAGPVKGEVFLQHGLEGSSSSGYLVSLAQALCEAGYAAHRVNMRGCGGSEHLTGTLYHSGLTCDLRAILRQFRDEGRGPLFLVGFSLGGNVALKLAGELGDDASDLLDAVGAVSTPIDLHACVQRIAESRNWIYQRRFVRSLRARYRRRHALNPDVFPIEGLDKASTIYDFDDKFTAPAFGFGTAQNYYRTQSAVGFVSSIRLPSLVVQAVDDPFIPFDIFKKPALRDNSWIHFEAVPHGGHLGFIAGQGPRFWLDGFLIEWIEGVRNNTRLATV